MSLTPGRARRVQVLKRTGIPWTDTVLVNAACRTEDRHEQCPNMVANPTGRGTIPCACPHHGERA